MCNRPNSFASSASGSSPAANQKKACCEVFFSIDTSGVGQFAGNVRVGLGEVEGEIPITVTVSERHEEYPEVLIVTTPFDRYSTSSGADFLASHGARPRP